MDGGRERIVIMEHWHGARTEIFFSELVNVGEEKRGKLADDVPLSTEQSIYITEEVG